MAKQSHDRRKFIGPILALILVLAWWLDRAAVSQASYNGLQTVPCQDPTKPVLQQFSLVIQVEVPSSTLSIPPNLGHDSGDCLHAIYANDSSGRVYVKSNDDTSLTLGQFFDVWKITFNDHQIDHLRTGDGHSLLVTTNGRTYHSELRSIPLRPNQVITVLYR